MGNSYEILPFFLLPDAENRLGFCFNDILKWDDVTLEIKHDYIQWYFPLLVASECNTSAPILSPYEREYLRNDPLCRARQTKAFNRMLEFFKIRRTISGFGPLQFKSHILPWVCKDPHSINHNYLRVTRIIHSLVLLGNERDAKRLYTVLNEKDSEEIHAPVFPARTIFLWKDALALTETSK